MTTQQAKRPTASQRALLLRLAGGELLWRDQVRGITDGNRWPVWRWNEVDRALSTEYVKRLEDAGWAETDDEDGTEVLRITAAGRLAVGAAPENKNTEAP